jgi:amylosucrase
VISIEEEAMAEGDWVRDQAQIALRRVVARLRSDYASARDAEPDLWAVFERRLETQWERLFRLLMQLYAGHYDFFYHLEQIISVAARSWLERPADLKQLDAQREADPDWFQSQTMVGAVCYVDLFAGTLAGLRERLPYLKQLGITYLHLMPLFAAPEGNSDGGYAVSSYRTVNPALGTMEELAELASALRQEGISLVVDFVFNHTSNEHAWALKAQAGDAEYQNYYLVFPDRTMPDRYDATTREIFPTVRRGSFSWNEPMRKWVWTTFNNFQWDLNYANPEVFRAMGEELLFLANVGVEALRLDAVAFIWKRLGTNSENQPEAHVLIQAFNALTRIACPALVFKSEAIVHPDEVKKYISPDEAQLSYNPLLMALLWEALATRSTRLLAQSIATRNAVPKGTAWVNYVRCHDDIGWTFDDDDARRMGIDPYGHRQFLNAFYIGNFPGSFARGLPFQFNPATGDARISGMLASLAGLEQAVQENNSLLIDLAVKRILLLHSIILSIGGIPLIYLNDEVAMSNDYNYVHNPAKADDSRWVHRVATDWSNRRPHNDMSRPEGYVFNEMLRLIALRKEQSAFWGTALEVIDTGNQQLFGYVRAHAGQRIMVIANFSERPQIMAANRLRLFGLNYQFTDLNTGMHYSASEPLSMAAYQFVWLATNGEG